jgi:hypothetical protein
LNFNPTVYYSKAVNGETGHDRHEIIDNTKSLPIQNSTVFLVGKHNGGYAES